MKFNSEINMSCIDIIDSYKNTKSMQPQQQPQSQRLSKVLTNISLIPVAYHADVQSLQPLLLSPESLHSPQLMIKLQTFSLLTKPAYHSLHWQEPNNENKYPVALLFCDKIEEGTQEFGVLIKVVTWIESGGIRCIAVSITEENLSKYLEISHCAIFVDFAKNQYDQNLYKKCIGTLMDLKSKEANYPMLLIGRSCIPALQIITSTSIPFQNKQQQTSCELYISHSSHLFKGLQLQYRIFFQNRKKHSQPLLKLLISTLLPYNYLFVSSFVVWKGQHFACSVQYKQKQIYCILCDPIASENIENIQLWHYAIINFVDACKKVKKQIDEKKVDKKLIAHCCKIVYKGQKGYYRFQ